MDRISYIFYNKEWLLSIVEEAQSFGACVHGCKSRRSLSCFWHRHLAKIGCWFAKPMIVGAKPTGAFILAPSSSRNDDRFRNDFSGSAILPGVIYFHGHVL